MKARVSPAERPDDEDEIDRILREQYNFHRLSKEEIDHLPKEELERLEDEYDVARAREILRAIEEGRMEVVSGRELDDELDRICGPKSKSEPK